MSSRLYSADLFRTKSPVCPYSDKTDNPEKKTVLLPCVPLCYPLFPCVTLCSLLLPCVTPCSPVLPSVTPCAPVLPYVNLC